MFGKLLRGLLLCASFTVGMLVAAPAMASASAIPSLGAHRQDVDESRYPWSAIGKLYNETGGSCSGVAIAANKVLTAAHCVFNFRSQRFIPANALHFLLGYRSGRYAMHARVASYEIGPGFDPLRYDATSDADWAILTVTENLPADIVPLRLSHSVEPSGTKAVIAGYPQDRAHAMTADSDCELREEIDGGRLLLHTCRGVGGYSGAPILVKAGGNEVQIAGIQIARFKSGGSDKMLAVTAQSIGQAGDREIRDIAPKPDVADVVVAAQCPVPAGSNGVAALQLQDLGLPNRPNVPVLMQVLPPPLLVAGDTDKLPALLFMTAYRPVTMPSFPSPLYPTSLDLSVAAADDFAARSRFAFIGSWSAAGHGAKYISY
jgi:protease YdgD